MIDARFVCTLIGIAITIGFVLDVVISYLENDLNCSHRWGQDSRYHSCMLRQFPYWDNNLSGVPQ